MGKSRGFYAATLAPNPAATARPTPRLPKVSFGCADL
jgi:hypothetical protein